MTRVAEPPAVEQKICREPWCTLWVASHQVTGAPGGIATGGQVAAASQGTLAPARSKGGVKELTGVGVSLRPGNYTPDGSGDASSALDAKCVWHRAERSPCITSFAPCNALRGGASISFPWM